MSRRTMVLVAVAGLGTATVVGLVRGSPGSDLAKLIALSFGVSVVVGGCAALLLRSGLPATLAGQVSVAAMASVIATGGGTLVAAKAMFVSAHDLTVLLVVLTAAATVGLLCALGLGARIREVSHVLREMTRRIGRDPAEVALSAPGTATSSTAELDALARELEAMSRQLAEAQERAHALDRSRRELVAWVSHDLRTPLAGIRAMAEALQDDVVTDPATVDRYHRTIQAETQRLTYLVDDLFELSRIQADALNLRLEAGSLGDVVSDALAAAQPLASARNVRLEGQLLNPPPVDLATSELGRVLQNLLENAIRHTAERGVVQVEVGGTDHHAYVTVRDECGGIPEGELTRVFDLAYRGDSARTPDDRRGGLGLAIAKGLVEAHDGELVVGNDGPGCRFTLSLPRRAAPAPSPVAAER